MASRVVGCSILEGKSLLIIYYPNDFLGNFREILVAETVFIAREQEANVFFRDWNASSTEVRKQNGNSFVS